ncbi:MAG TPA: NAD-dependent epimerase/dehydratase family protein [Bacteroidales bacterium]|nr:NAD-dependent epimerase/dehydratase family protein [Bacteroidales bacterium]
MIYISLAYFSKKYSFITLDFTHFVMKVAVTGASGHIGNCLVRELKKQGAMIKAANYAGAKKFIHFSSIHAFQTEPSDMILDESRSLVESDKTIYEFTKAEGEREVMKAVKEGLNAVIINPTAVIGPFDSRGSLLGQALLKIYQNKLPFLVSGGYNWVDVRDVVSASIQAIESGNKGERYILSGEFCTLQELSAMISKISGNKIPVIVPVSLARLACPFFQIYSSVTKKEPLYTYQSLDILVNSPVNISNAKARKDMGYEPRPLEQTLIDTFNWYRGNNFIN